MPDPLSFPLCLPGAADNPFTPWPYVAGASALALIVAAAALAFSRRAVKGARPLPGLAIPVWGVGAWALLLTAWAWTASQSFVGGGCVIYYNSFPVSQEDAPSVAVLASVATALVAGILLVVSAVVALRRLRGRRTPAIA